MFRIISSDRAEGMTFYNFPEDKTKRHKWKMRWNYASSRTTTVDQRGKKSHDFYCYFYLVRFSLPNSLLGISCTTRESFPSKRDWCRTMKLYYTLMSSIKTFIQIVTSSWFQYWIAGVLGTVQHCSAECVARAWRFRASPQNPLKWQLQSLVTLLSIGFNGSNWRRWWILPLLFSPLDCPSPTKLYANQWRLWLAFWNSYANG